MGLFGSSSPFDVDVEKITDGKNTSEDWGHIMDLCDRVQATQNGPKDCLKSVIRRLNHQDPHVVMQAITLLDACVSNCGKGFCLEVASREFETEYKKLLAKSHPQIKEKLKGMLKKWAEGDFKNDFQLSLIPSLYAALKKEGIDFSSSQDPCQKKRTAPAAASRNPNVVSSQQEEEDIAKAIQLSLQEHKSPTKRSGGAAGSSTTATTGSLYPSATTIQSNSTPKGSTPKKDEKKARALYDFEADEDNELTFRAGEIVIVTDDSDVNWWRGSNHRGEGLFPANFVTTDLDKEPEQFSEEKQKRSVHFNEQVEVKTVKTDSDVIEVNENMIDQVLKLLHEADPTSPEHDSPDLPRLEEMVLKMGPLIDAELECVDRRHAQLTRLSTELVDALNLYHQLMRDIPAPPNPMYGAQAASSYVIGPQPQPYGLHYGPPPPQQQQPSSHPMFPAPHFMPGGYMAVGPGLNNGFVPVTPTDMNSMYMSGTAPPPPTPPLMQAMVPPEQLVGASLQQQPDPHQHPALQQPQTMAAFGPGASFAVNGPPGGSLHYPPHQPL